MGQEIFYCSKCQVRLRTPDFESAKAFRILDQICCAACAQEVIRTLPPDSARKFIQGLATARETPEKPLSDSSRGRIEVPPPTSTPRMPLRVPEPERSNSALGIGIAAAIGVALIVVVAAVLSSSDRPPAPRPSPVAAAPIEIPSPPPRKEEPARPPIPKAPPKEEPLRPAEFAPTPKPAEPPVEPPKPEPAPKPAEPIPAPAPAPEPVARPPAPSPEPTKPKRPPVPDAAKQRASEAAVKKTFNVEQAKAPKDKGELARTILMASAGSPAGDPDYYVRLRSARDLAATAADSRTALQAIDAMAAGFEIDSLEEKVSLLTKTTVRAPDAVAWAKACLDVARQVSASDEYEAAGKIATRAESLAVAAKDIALRDDARDKLKEYTEFRREWDKVKPFLETLKTAPEDPAACTAMGRYLCLIKEDWDKGLPLLAKGADGPLKRLAELELAKPAEASAQAALGEAWGAHAEKELLTPKSRAKVRALEWLERALPSLSGPAKTAAEKRLSQLGLLLGSKAPPVLELGGGVRLDLIYCKAGSYPMGSPDAPPEAWVLEARPVHKVELTRGFFLGKTEVTRGQFAAFVKATGYVSDAERLGQAWGRRPNDNSWGEVPGVTWKKMYFPQTDDDPVLAMSFNDGKAFCDWLSSATRRRVRLPTEAEWEYACRAGTTTPYPFASDTPTVGEYTWHRDNSGLASHPVASKKPNPWGFYDMNGNAWEWCQDWLGGYKNDARDPEGTAPEIRGLRGGCYDNFPTTCLSSARIAVGPGTPTICAGFRVLVR